MAFLRSIQERFSNKREAYPGVWSKIDIDKKGAFHPGDTVSGRFHLGFEKGAQTTIEGTPMIVLKGFETSFSGLIGMQERTYQQCVFYTNSIPVGEQDTFSPFGSEKIWSFQMTLPKNVPPTVHCPADTGSFAYYISGIIEPINNDDKRLISPAVEIQIEGVHEDKWECILDRRIDRSERKKFSSKFGADQGVIEIRAVVDRENFSLGDTLSVKVKIVNSSAKRIVETMIIIKERVESNTPLFKGLLSNTILNEKSLEVPKRATTTKDRIYSLSVPENCLPDSNGKYLRIVHSLIVLLTIKNGDDMKLSIPIVIWPKRISSEAVSYTHLTLPTT
eukprot:TRINITY_DN5176_c0_g1_i3.p1 TRINITY_DN5176_c0_g1~~TRINITY_DN5176_c0_g1_i3.p1  ORF type:complete len:334 (-),score=82.26 TRINITY_DN5176_c0_g1_i3:9-1010(-)